MTAISGILFKITCESEIPATLFQDPSMLLTMDLDDVNDADITQYLQYKALVTFAFRKKESTQWFNFYDRIKDKTFYTWCNYKDLDNFLATTETDFYKNKFLPLQNKIFAGIGWHDHGYKIVSDNWEKISSWYPTDRSIKMYNNSFFPSAHADQMWANP